MNGIITISDGQGTTIENGVVDTDSLITDTMTSTNMISTNMIVPRVSPTLTSLLGSTVNLTTLCQNLNFNTTNRNFEIWDDQATGQIFIVDVSNNTVYINTLNGYFAGLNSLQFLSPNLQLLNSNVSFPNSTVSFNSYLPTTTITTGFANNNFITKAYGDSVYHPLGSYASLPGNNIYTGTNQFNSNLPTSTLTPTLGTQLITKTYGDSTYPLKSGSNSFTGTNTFNNNLPTSTLTSATLGTQFITRAIADGRFGQLATANTWTLQNTFQNGILPCTTLTTTNIQLGGNNQLQYRQATSLNNISIGNNTIRGDSNALGVANNTGSRNIGVGGEVLVNLDSGSDMIFIGYQAGQNCGSTRINNVQPQRCIAIGTFSQRGNLYATDAISIGYNSLVSASGPAIGNICIGSNVGNGINFQSYNVLIGTECGPYVNDNAVTGIGYQCLGDARGQFNSGVALGTQAGFSNNGGAGGTFIGTEAFYTNTTGQYNTGLGLKAGRGSPANGNYMTCIGAFSSASSNNECVFGGATITDQLFLTLPQKNRLYCNQVIGAVATYSITFRSNENVIVNSSLTTQINLPQATTATAVRLGATFNIIRTSGATSNIIISAFGTETIFYSGSASTSVPIDSWVNSISFVCVNNVAGSPMWAVCRYNDRVTLATDARKLQTLSDSSNVNYPVCFTTISNGTNYNNVYAESSLTYNPSTDLMTVPNLTVTGSLNATSTTSTNLTITDRTGDSNTYYINFTNAVSGNLSVSASSDLKYTPLSKTLDTYKIISSSKQISNIPTLITSTTTLTFPLLEYYTFTMKTAAGYVINFPEITASTVGSKTTLKRIGGSPQVLQIGLANNQAVYIGSTSTTIATPANLLATTQTHCQLIATQIGDIGAGTFTNLANQFVVIINTQSSGTIAIGTRIYLGAVLGYRFITSYQSGVGGLGSYSVNAVLPTASSGVAYTTEITYGWAVVSIA
jgi:hypothetical protein